MAWLPSCPIAACIEITKLRRQLARYGVDPRPFTPITRIKGSRERIHRTIRLIRSAEAGLPGDLHDFTEAILRREQRQKSSSELG